MKNQITQLFSTCLNTRQVHLSAMCQFRQNTRERPDIHKTLENEKRGVFRVLDIGKPRPVKLGRTPFAHRRYLMPGPPRYVICTYLSTKFERHNLKCIF